MSDFPHSVVLVDARTATERTLIARWAAIQHPSAAVVPAGDPKVLSSARDGDPMVVPVRITWLPPERAHNTTPRLGDLVALLRPRRPWAFVQERLVRSAPDAVKVVAGEPARISELRERFRAEEADAGDDAFVAYLARTATLACERAERTLIGDRYKVPRLVVEQITASAGFRQRVAALAAKLGCRDDDVLAEATEALSDLVTVQSPPAIDAYRAVLAPMHSSAWRVLVDTGTLERLRELNRKHALVFLPAHRSYVDPLVLAEVLHEHDFPRNHLLGGDNMAFWPIGALGKRAGVIFIRRGGGDPPYKLALREYLGHLVAKRFNLEWYIEGGRSRTGKLRPPRLGLLKYLTDALDDGRADDVALVPVSMVYDQMHEVAAMAAEQGGARKKAEGLRWMLRYIQGQRRNEGTAQVRFGEPFSLRQALQDAGDGRARLEKVAFQICDGINRATPVTSVALVTFALLGTRDRALTLHEVSRVTAPLLDYIEHRGIPGPVSELRDMANVRWTLDRLVKVGVASRYDGGREPVWSITEGHHRIAAFYRNGALHHLVTRAIVELSLLKLTGEGPVPHPTRTAWAESLRLRDLLKFEFFFPSKNRFHDDVVREVALFDEAWDTRTPSAEDATKLLASSRFLAAPRTLRPFLEAQLVVALELAAVDPKSSIDPDAFLDRCLGVGHQMLLQGRLHAPDSVSRELYATALRLADNRAVVTPGRDNLSRARALFLAQVEDVLSRIERAAELERTVLDEVLHDGR